MDFPNDHGSLIDSSWHPRIYEILNRRSASLNDVFAWVIGAPKAIWRNDMDTKDWMVRGH